jgi:two-component system cell cycle sensor histidine kinase/response regulator CckA
MVGKDNRPAQAAELRRRAEEMARGTAVQLPEVLDVRSPEETRQTLHELRVHQIELELQNDELRRAQAELDASRARYFDLYDLAPVGYITVSEQGLILEANLTAAILLGVARGVLVERLISRFILNEDQNIYYLHRKQLFETGEPQAYELRMVKKDGTAFWAHLEAAAAQDADGALTFRTVLSDITERKRAEEEKSTLEAQNRQLQKAESLGRMAGAIVHHFNNLLQAIIGNMQLAIHRLPQDADSVKYMTAAMQAARTAEAISDQTLTYLGDTSDKLEPLDLCDVCRLFLPMLQAAIPKNVILETDLPSHGPTITANANQMQQVLTNLVTNAWEALGDGRGVIHLRVKTVSAADIPTIHGPIDWRPQDSVYVCLEVSDTGSGIAHSDIEKLFDPFFSGKFIGRGLGLSVVLGIAKAHHGAIAVQSEPGRGSTFRVFLPASAENVVV